jgi:hypothetical protein
MLEELYNAYKNSRLDMYLHMRRLVQMQDNEDRYFAYEKEKPFTLLESMLRYSINFIICSSSFMRFLFMQFNIAFNLAISFEVQV